MVYTIVAGGLDTGWTFYTPYSANTGTSVVSALGWCFHSRILIHPDGYQLHGDSPQDACTWNDLEENATLHLGALCHISDSDFGYSRYRDHALLDDV